MKQTANQTSGLNEEIEQQCQGFVVAYAEWSLCVSYKMQYIDKNTFHKHNIVIDDMSNCVMSCYVITVILVGKIIRDKRYFSLILTNYVTNVQLESL